MDKSEDSPESGRDQWVTLEHAAELADPAELMLRGDST